MQQELPQKCRNKLCWNHRSEEPDRKG